ncbi:MAG: hypothetical protein ABI045_01515 [Flavobacteriales bacterium]
MKEQLQIETLKLSRIVGMYIVSYEDQALGDLIGRRFQRKRVNIDYI